MAVNFDVKTNEGRTAVFGSFNLYLVKESTAKNIKKPKVSLWFAWIVSFEYLPFELIALILLESKTQKP